MTTLLATNASDTVLLKAMDKAALDSYKKDLDALHLNQIENQQFKAKFASHALMTNSHGVLEQVLVGTEKVPEDPRATVMLFATIAKALPPRDYSVGDGFGTMDQEQMAVGWGLASYKFTRYLKDEPKAKARLSIPEGVSLERVQNQLASVFLARDLVNTPAGDLTTTALCEEARKVAEDCGAEISITTGKELEEGYPAVHAVGKGSEHPPALIDIRWGNESDPKLTIVGKGVVFDSGGLDIKPPVGMRQMKKDMGGSAVALGLSQLIMKQGLKVRLRLLIPTVENAVSGTSYRPGDVINTRKGLTVEIGNTDAEGRLILCDALAEAVTEDPDMILDMATLTGAARIALGQDLPAMYTGNDEIAKGLEAAGSEVADPIWRMPLWLPYTKTLKSSIADLNNMANTGKGGSITAALYLHEFVKPYKNWAHFDIYCWRDDAMPGSPKGGEASALRAMFRYLENRYT